MSTSIPRKFFSLALAAALLAACDSRTAVGGDAEPRQVGGDAVADGRSPDVGWRDGARPDAAAACQHPAVVRTCANGWCTIPAGCFTMGSPKGEPCRGGDETQHQVTLSRAFELMATEVTQQQFKSLMGHNPSYFSSCGKDCPVDYLSWHMAASYCNALSAAQGRPQCYYCKGGPTSVTCEERKTYAGGAIYGCPGYRLPTEAEWEYAYRAGTSSPLYNGPVTHCYNKDPGVAKIAWYGGNAGNTPHTVGGRQPNAWGLYDMAGNVTEYVHDRFIKQLGAAAVKDPAGGSDPSRRGFRGGDCSRPPAMVRAAFRLNGSPATRYSYLGVRCARSL